jgi:C-terminal processing protease CtpA/Prc/NADPH-dependent 2,4-dienoyl-CoA reductase/sulfur reductase-like enzyme
LVSFIFEGDDIRAQAGQPLAVALYAARVTTLARSPKYHRPRGLFCLAGHCASCLMRVDGRPNVRACMVPTRAGLRCERQNAFPSAGIDVLAAADWLFPDGMDHHTMMTGSRAGNALFLKLVREMGGSGTLPDAEVSGRTDAPIAAALPDRMALDVCIVGGGPAGLAAARTIAEAAPGARVDLFDDQLSFGGSLLCTRGGGAYAASLADAARAVGANLHARAAAIAFYPEDTGPDGRSGVLAVTTDDRLVRVGARRFLYATGAYDQNLAFVDNDRPFVMAARACGRLAFLWGVRPVPRGRRVVVIGDAPTGAMLEDDLVTAGVEVERIAAADDMAFAARGTTRARGIDVETAGTRRSFDAALIAVAALPSPASELPRQHGATVELHRAGGGFRAVTDARGATSVPDVFACGDVTGYLGPAAAAEAGARVGRAVAATLTVLMLLAGLAPTIGCSTPAAPPAETPASVPAAPPPGVIEPPPFSSAAAPNRNDADAARTALRRSILDAAWRTVRDKHYDPTLGGLDWKAVRAKYEPLAIGAPSDAAFYRVLNQMIGELGQSHMLITGPGDENEADAEEMAPPGETPDTAAAPASDAIGDPGLTVRVIDGRPTVTRVRGGSSGDRAGVAPGFIITQIGGRSLEAPRDSSRPLRPVEERFAIRRTAARRLAGPIGSRVSVAFLDDRDRPGKAVLVREALPGPPVQIGHLPPLHPDVRAFEVGDVGVVAFNLFFLQPVLGEIKQAVARFEAHHMRAVILDLRGNPGGQGAMAIPVASLFVSGPVALGTLTFRGFNQKFEAKPELGATPFTGPLAILTDEGTASTAEMLAAGLQEAGRAVVVGDATLGAVLPSVIAALPGGAVMQYVVADFKTPKGVLLEGRGVQPDRRAIETRAALRSGRDLVLDAALVALRGSRRP